MIPYGRVGVWVISENDMGYDIVLYQYHNSTNIVFALEYGTNSFTFSTCVQMELNSRKMINIHNDNKYLFQCYCCILLH